MEKNQKKQFEKKESVLINFNKNLYSSKAIKLAIKEYQNLANFSLRRKGNYIEIELKDINKKVGQIIKDEFCNYVLSLMKS